MKNSAIEWTDHTFNPWIGCTKVSPGCDHCYAEQRMDKRLHTVNWGPGQPRKRTSAANWREPVKWNNAHAEFYAQHARRQRVFCASLADVFDNEVDPQWRRDLFDLIELTPNLDWLLLTKRIGNVRDMVRVAKSGDWLAGRKNVWLGATITSQAEADRDIPKLLQVPAAKRFLSMEPLLGPVDLAGMAARPLWPITSKRIPHIDWVIVGGESGPNARPMHPDWARSLRNQCMAAGVPFLFKQWGEWWPIDQQQESDTNAFYRSVVKAREHESQSALDECYGRRCTVPNGVVHNDGSLHDITEPMSFRQGTDAMTTFKVGKQAAGRLLDGRTWDETPT